MVQFPASGVRRDERGASLTAFTATIVLAVFLVAGLVVDGTAQVRSHRHAEVAAARAVRQGCDAGAAQRLLGQDGSASALAAARRALADEGVQGEVRMRAGVLEVDTTTRIPTTFLGLLGVDELEATGRASGELRRV